MRSKDQASKLTPPAHPQLSRRSLLKSAASVAALGAAGIPSTVAADSDEGITRGRVKQSIVYWCFRKHWTLEKTCEVAKELGCRSVELVAPESWSTLRDYGLTCAIAPSHGFQRGMNNPDHHAECLEKLRSSIEAAASFGVGRVITFTGFSGGVSPEDGIDNCVEGYKKILGLAEEKKVDLCLEMLNSRVNEEMKGHPGYQGDHLDYCLEILRQVGSPRLKLLFDIYHVQIMDGDVIVRLRACSEVIGHVHTAGNPGRRELDDKQELQYRPIVEALVETGYDGYLGQEFIPTRDPLEGLREAVRLCDV